MLEGDSMGKSVRLVRLQNLLYRNPRGLSTKELATASGVCVRTIQRDLLALAETGVPLEKSDDRYRILSGYFVPPVHFDFAEATALFLAARLLYRCSDEHNPNIVTGLAKLANVLPSPVGEQLQQAVAAMTELGCHDRGFSQIFDAVAECWSTQRRVRIWHRGAERQDSHEYLLAPYVLEPGTWGNAIYVIGDVGPPRGLLTFKLERIARAEPTDESFVIPADFVLADFLAGAWGIMGGGPVVDVLLRFSPAVAGRVKESIWHRSQQFEDGPDGGVLLRLKVSHTIEMMPWLRGWGPNVEVLAPAELRRQIAADSRTAAAQYKEDEG